MRGAGVVLAMRRILSDLADAWHETPPAILGATLVGSAVLCLLLLTLLLGGCAHTRAGLARERVAFQGATNLVATGYQLLPYTPPPTNCIGEAILGAVTAGLTAWNASQHRRIKQLEDKTNGGKPATP